MIILPLIWVVIIMIDTRIKKLREQSNLTQSALAKRLGISRSSVNAWEMGISVPSTQYIVELSQIFGISTDYLLGLNSNNIIDITGLPENDVNIIHQLVHHLKEKQNAK